jgi:hypothetical protein
MVCRRGLHDLLLGINCSLNAIFTSGSSQLRKNFSYIELRPSPDRSQVEFELFRRCAALDRSQVEFVLLRRCAALDSSFLAAAYSLAAKATKF